VLSARAPRATADNIAHLESGPLGDQLSALATELARLVERAVAEAFPEGTG
jgi:hypothetical protein